MAPSRKLHFEQAMQRLNQLVEKMEAGQNLESSLKDFETGIDLIRQCQKILSQAEQKVQMLTEKNGQTVLTDFDSDEK